MLLATTALAVPAQADDRVWTGNTDSNWHEGANWDTAVPGAGDTAVFGADENGFIFVAAPASTGSLRFAPSAGSHWLDLGAGFTLTGGIDNQSASNQDIFIGFGATLRLTGGTIEGPVNLLNNSALVFENASAGSATITNNPGATITFGTGGDGGEATIDNQSQVTFEAGSSAGNAEITNNAFGAATTFNAGSTAGEATIVNTNNGGVHFLGDSNAGSATISNTAGSVIFNDTASAGTATIGNVVSGGPTFRTIVLNDESTAGAASITTAGGSVNFHDESSAGTATLTANLGGRIVFQDTSSAGQSTLIANTGSAILFRLDSSGGSARLIVNQGAAASINQLTVASMTIGSIEGEGGLVLGNKELIVGGNDLSTTFAGTIVTAGGKLTKTGMGMLTLEGNSIGFDGSAAVEQGTLAVNGTLAGALAVLSGGRLQGTGTVGDTEVSGIIAPGNSIGTLAVAGDITFNADSTYEVEIDPAGARDGIAATGKAIIDGGTVKVLAAPGSYAPGTVYTILTAADGLAGTFAGVSSDFIFAFLDPSLSYDDTGAYLSLDRNAVSFASAGTTRNQAAAGGGVESLGSGNEIYDSVLLLTTSEAGAAFDQLSGEIHASALSVLIEDSRFLRNAVNDRLRQAFGDAWAASAQVMALAADSEDFAVWGQGFGSWGEWDGDDNAADLERSTGGLFLGADGTALEGLRLGIIAGLSHTGFDVDDRSSSGTSDNYHLGVYGGTHWGDLGFRAGLAYTRHLIETKRSAQFADFSDSLKSDYGAGTAQAFGEVGYGITVSAFAFEPFANLAYVNVETDDVDETGGAAALDGSGSADQTFTTLGLRASADIAGGGLRAEAMAGWRRAFGDDTPEATLALVGGDDFSIAGIPVARDMAVIEAGLDADLASRATLAVSYGGQFGSGFSDQSVKASLDLQF